MDFSRLSRKRMAYEEVLSTMVASLGDQPQDVLRGAADEVLAWLKVRGGESEREGSTDLQEISFGYHWVVSAFGDPT